MPRGLRAERGVVAVALRDRTVNPAKPAKVHPKGWEPGIDWNGKSGTISSGPIEAEPTDEVWGDLMNGWGFDPKTMKIVDGTLQVRAWDAPIGNSETKLLRYYKVQLQQNSRVDQADIDELCALVRRRRPARKVTTRTEVERALVVALSDWQVGKAGEEGGGTPEFTERLLATFDRLLDHAKRLRREQGIDIVYLIGLGDLIENCSGHYASQTFNVDLDRRQQVRLVRHLILQLVDRFTTAKFRIVLAAVGGNHGEARQNGRAYTNVFTDNDDLAVVEQVAEIIAVNPERYGNVSVPLGAIAEDHCVTLDICGVAVGFAHGHQVKGGVPLWWQKQSHGKQSIGHADILVTAHFHHLVVSEVTGRTWFQCPAMDGGSRWYTAGSGASAPAGMLTFVAGRGCGVRGWDSLAVL